MWRTTHRLATSALTAALALAAYPATPADAGSMVGGGGPSADPTTVADPTTTVGPAVGFNDYTTDGSIAGMAGPQAISFAAMPDPTRMTNPGTFDLGKFSVGPLASTLTDTNTPFNIDLRVPTASGGTPYDYQIAGVLNGMIGDRTSTMVATVNSITGVGSNPPFDPHDLFVPPQGLSAPDGSTPGSTTLRAVVMNPDGFPRPAPAPEPTSVAAFAAALAGWAMRRRILRAKKA